MLLTSRLKLRQVDKAHPSPEEQHFSPPPSDHQQSYYPPPGETQYPPPNNTTFSPPPQFAPPPSVSPALADGNTGNALAHSTATPPPSQSRPDGPGAPPPGGV
ncbi:hypothetical protein LTS01_003703 [Friedmanniomyces endolithicus]|nr:hypothetical protein LTS01_003703 [Friedmanniomyces endolithicus]